MTTIAEKWDDWLAEHPSASVPCMLVYRWSDAPPVLRDRCTCHGGDEDWLTVAPANWLEDPGFSLYLPEWSYPTKERNYHGGWGWSCREVHTLPDGSRLVVFAHS